MKIRYRGRQKGWRIFLRKGAVQIDIGGKSKRKGFPVIQMSAWDERKHGFVYLESYFVRDGSHATCGIDYYSEFKENEGVVKEDLLYVSPVMIKEGCSNPLTCEATKTYLKEMRTQ